MKEKLLKRIFIMTILSILITCSSIKTEKEIFELKDFIGVKGYHCESTSIMNALYHQGLTLSEIGRKNYNRTTLSIISLLTRIPDNKLK